MFITSPLQRTVIKLQQSSARNLLLLGPPGSGKTQFAYHMAEQLGATFFRYDCRPDKERDMLYDFDVDGIVTRTAAYVKGSIWQAFEASLTSPVVILLDEVDKSDRNFDAFLLRILEECTFTAPKGGDVQGIRENIIFVLTSNGRRELRPEVQRRTQRFFFDLPSGHLHATIVSTMTAAPNSLVSLACRIAESLRQSDLELCASPKEVANLCNDLLIMKGCNDKSLIEAIVSSYMLKGTMTLNCGFNAVSAIITELKHL